jgi:hypothetical protein
MGYRTEHREAGVTPPGASLRRSVWLVGVRLSLPVIVILVGFASVSSALANGFGVNVIYSSGCGGHCTLRAVRSDIHSPAAGVISVPNGNVLVERVDAEGDLDQNLMQMGFGRTNNPPISFDCGGSNGTKRFWEHITNSGNNQTCNWLLGTVDTTDKYSVDRVTDCGTCWAAFLNGSRLASSEANVNFDQADLVLAGGEILDQSGSPSGFITANFGPDWPTSGIPWERSADVVGSQTWSVIMSSQKVNTNGDWTIGDAPSPFLIKYTP